MKFKHRILSALLALTLLMSVSINAEYSVDYIGDKYEAEIGFLYSLGIVQGDQSGAFNPDKELTRAEFLTMVFNMMQYDSMLGASGFEQHFYDCSPEHWAFGCVEAAYQLGLVNGMGDGRFGVDESVTLNQATKIILSALDYGYEAENRGGYPNGYLAVGIKHDLFKKLSAGERKLKRNEAAALICNALFIPSVSWINGEKTEMSTVLEMRGMEKFTGMVTSTYDAQLNGELEKGTIEISSQKYDIGYDYGEDWLGTQVYFYFDRDSEKIIYMTQKSARACLVVDNDDIEDSTTLSALVYRSNNKMKSEQLPDSLRIVYNGKTAPTSQITDKILKPAGDGTITLIDFERDNIYDVAVVKDYTSMILTSYVNETLYGKYGEKVKLEDVENIVVEKDGNKISIEEVQIGEAIVVAASSDGELVRIIVGGSDITGTVETFDSEENIYTILSDGEEAEYKLAVSYERAIKANNSQAHKINLGDTVDIKLDYFGKIIGVSSEESEFSYGYLYQSAKGSFGKKAEFEILTTANKFEVFEAASDKILFGRVTAGKYTSNKTETDTVIDSLDDGQLVTYKLNADGKLTELSIADTSVNQDDFSRDVYFATHHYGADRLFEGKYVVDEKTKCFYIPAYGGYKDLMSYGLYNTYFSVGSDYRVEFYDVENYHVGAVLISVSKVHRYEAENNGYTVLIDKVNSPVLYINKVINAPDAEGEIKMCLEGYQNGEEVKVYVADKLSDLSESRSNLRPGMAIQYELNTVFKERAETSDLNLEMELYKTVFDFRDSHRINEELFNYAVKPLNRPEISTVYSNIDSVDANRIALKTGRSAVLHAEIMVLKYDESTHKFEQGVLEDLAIGQEVFMRQRYWNIREIVMIY